MPFSLNLFSRRGRSALLPAMLLTSMSCLAAGYPEKPVRIVTPFPTNSVTDVLARPIAAKLTEAWGQTVIVDNRSGTAGMLGTELVAKAAPDGHTLLMGTNATHAINPGLFKNLSYDPVRDFAPITLVATSYLLLVVNAGVPANTVRELVAMAKAKPGKMTYGSAGSGSSPHLAAELFKTMAGIDFLHVPYKGSPQILIDVLGGRIDVYFSNAAVALPQVKSGKLKLLGVTGAKREATLPDVPTVSEAGVPDFEATSWFGMYAPARTPTDIIARVNADIVRIVAMPEVKKQFDDFSLTASTSTPAEFGAFGRRELEKWTRVVKASGAIAE